MVRSLAVLLLVASLPTPPRVAVIFTDCPEGGGPRQHVVSAGLSAHLPRATFRAMANADRVDVVFVQPDPAWRQW